MRLKEGGAERARENVSKKEECSVEDNDDDDVNISILPDLVLSTSPYSSHVSANQQHLYHLGVCWKYKISGPI